MIRGKSETWQLSMTWHRSPIAVEALVRTVLTVLSAEISSLSFDECSLAVCLGPSLLLDS